MLQLQVNQKKVFRTLRIIGLPVATKTSRCNFRFSFAAARFAGLNWHRVCLRRCFLLLISFELVIDWRYRQLRHLNFTVSYQRSMVSRLDRVAYDGRSRHRCQMRSRQLLFALKNMLVMRLRFFLFQLILFCLKHMLCVLFCLYQYQFFFNVVCFPNLSTFIMQTIGYLNRYLCI